LRFGCVSGLPERLLELKSPRCSAQSLQSKPNLIYRDFPVRFGFSPWLFRLLGGARGELTFLPRKSRSGDGLAPYSQESKLKALARLLQSLSLRAAMGNASRTELCCLMGRLPGSSLEAPLFEVWLRLRASRAPSGAQIAALQRTKSPVETKFDLQRLSCQVWVLSMAFPAFGGGAG